MKKRSALMLAAIGLAGIGVARKTSSFLTKKDQKSSSDQLTMEPSPLNWPWIMYNIGEELTRANSRGESWPSAIRNYQWLDDRTLEVQIIQDERFPDGGLVNAASVKANFEAGIHPSNPYLSSGKSVIDPETRCEAIDEYTLRFILPKSGEIE